jgi:hypothetical protein
MTAGQTTGGAIPETTMEIGEREAIRARVETTTMTIEIRTEDRITESGMNVRTEVKETDIVAAESNMATVEEIEIDIQTGREIIRARGGAIKIGSVSWTDLSKTITLEDRSQKVLKFELWAF